MRYLLRVLQPGPNAENMNPAIDFKLLALITGYILDLLLGDPRWLPHPIRLFGTLIAKGEQWLNKDPHRLIKGAMLTLVLCGATFATFFYLLRYIPWPGGLFVFYGLANTSLLQEGKAVFNQLDTKGLEAGRKRLSWIVGRDTSQLDGNQIRTAVFETLSENLSDGVIAPLFYFAIGGVPAMMTYKMINTLDSMIGYKKERYRLFGRFAARLDDVANYIPARLTALLMVLVTFSKRGLQYIFKYGHKHASPNSGYPEAALAGILHCRFGGPNTYDGVVVEKPYIGDNHRFIFEKEFIKVVYINHAVTFVMVILIILLRLFIKI
jgi:adenosylcobinamide-phosphate synthase